MANGLDTLGSIFNVRRREKPTRDKAQASKRKIVDQQFPAPSYLQPRSQAMAPREDFVTGADDRNRASTIRSRTRRRNSNETLCSLREMTASRPESSSSSYVFDSEFDDVDRFRQMSFWYHKPVPSLRSNGSSTCRAITPADSVRDRVSPVSTACDTPRTGLLDWSPKRSSALFDMANFETEHHEPAGRPPEKIIQSPVESPSCLLPAAEIIPGMTPSSLKRKSKSSSSSPGSRRRSPSASREPRYSLFPKNQHPALPPPPCLKINIPPAYSPTTSGGDDGTPITAMERSMSVSSLASMSSATTASDYTESSTMSSCCEKTERKSSCVRESWGVRPCDPCDFDNCRDARYSLDDEIISAAVLHSGQRDATSLSKLETLFGLDDHDISEPIEESNIQDFSASLTSSPTDGPNSLHPIGKPPKTRSVISTLTTDRSSCASSSALSRCQDAFLQTSGIRAALMAADIASEYNFDVMYLVSLWPRSADDQYSPSILSSSRFQLMRPVVQLPSDSHLSGRFLASHGLQNCKQGLPISTNMLLKALGSDKTPIDAQGKMMSVDPINGCMNGSMCSFAAHRVNVDGGAADKQLRDQGQNNYGFVFAAFTRDQKSSIGTSKELSWHKMQGELRNRVKTLLDILVPEVSQDT